MRASETTILLFVTFCLSGLSFSTPCSAQTTKSKNQSITRTDSLKMKERWSFKTNAIDWLLTVPNATVEFDLSKSPYAKNTLSLSVLGNWETKHTYRPNYVFNIFSGKLEFRNYWRTQQRQVVAGDTSKLSFMQRIRNGLSRRRLHPRTWRAYYLGGYASGGTYSMKFGREGRQGQFLSAGLSFGYSVPLYGYTGNHLDIEFGGSVGAVATKYDIYTRNVESNSYVVDHSRQRGWHVLPYPVVTDINVSLVYRFTSIKEKYRLINFEKIARKQEEKRRKENYRDSVNTANKIRQRIERRQNEWKRDSLFRAKEIAKLAHEESKHHSKKNSKNDKTDKDTILSDSTLLEALPTMVPTEATKPEEPAEGNPQPETTGENDENKEATKE